MLFMREKTLLTAGTARVLARSTGGGDANEHGEDGDGHGETHGETCGWIEVST